MPEKKYYDIKKGKLAEIKNAFNNPDKKSDIDSFIGIDELLNTASFPKSLNYDDNFNNEANKKLEYDFLKTINN
ncbi:hypothetical protein AAEX28_06575 [Lentisphaerota bacterium WC36G]|nr:hypothetical protein LJT99_09440 [Lentisphaerae bacterium WC36]